MKIGELAKRAGLSAHTLRYYERIGLLPRADRDASGQRDYDASIISWIGFLERLKTTGMPIREMLRYAALREQGAETGTARRVLLEAHRDKVRAHVADLQAALLVLDTKIGGYAEAEQRMENHDAELPDVRRKPVGARPARARGN
ncbi:MerR family transcriptional regulator [Paenirhodobacter populi]|uniref:MerR family transcriptional regulator n=1 Tax=Paenirhodobacter populi TaxID=2306993 RepID=A0A443JRD2_9RHOB|nr:MerR family transcriptional regulator [Sinirhodobacter populi]RWR23073.1 MerR family transcriptional regulator [Sinirhodobacter populi]